LHAEEVENISKTAGGSTSDEEVDKLKAEISDLKAQIENLENEKSEMASKGDETAKENEENEDKVLLLQSTITDKDNEI